MNPTIRILILMCVAIAPVAYAQNIQATSSEIAPQTLSGALSTFAKQTGLQLIYVSDIAEGQKSKGVPSGLSRGDALKKLLEGTGLSFEFINEHTVRVFAAPTIRPARTSMSGAKGWAERFRLAQVEESKRDETPRSSERSSQNSSESSEERVLDEVVVTGTHIHGGTAVGTPVRTIDRREIERSGYATLDQLMQSLPENFRGSGAGASPDAVFTRGADRGANFTFGSGVNLRGLGSTATLVLVNGHRVAPSGAGYFTDISTIPLSAIEKVDVLKDGASAIYGSDSIAGVVNFTLKRETEGFDVAARYGHTADGPSTLNASTQFGHGWGGGGFTAGVDYLNQGTLDVSDRSFTSTIASPTSLFPHSRQIAVSAAAHHELGERFEGHGDAQYSKSHRYFLSSTGGVTSGSNIDVPRFGGAVGASYRLSNSWLLRYELAAGQGKEDSVAYNLLTGAAPAFSSEVRELSRFSENSISASGDLFRLPGGAVKLAAGGSYLSQGFSHFNRNAFGELRYGADRKVAAAYSEMLIPIIGEANGITGVRGLTLSVAGRYDHYSDFGSTTNPKYGISWYPVTSIEIRGAYSESFRAPATGLELVRGDQGTTGVLIFPTLNPERTARIPVLFALGARPGLQPEQARNVTIGLNFRPTSLEGFDLQANYFDIKYSGRLAGAPFSATGLSDPALASAITQYTDNAALREFVDAAVASGALFTDATGSAFGSDPLAVTRYLYDLRVSNLARTATTGVELTVGYPFHFGNDSIATRIDATYVTKFTSQLSASAPDLELVNTVGQPSDLRIRAQADWTHGPLSLAIAVNYVSEYPDTSSPTPRTVAAYDTFDIVGSYDFLRTPGALENAQVTVAVTNLFNSGPPFVAFGALDFDGSHYDPANASPLGRQVSIGFSKHW